MQRATLETGSLLSRIRNFLEERRPQMRIGRVERYIGELDELTQALAESTIENQTRLRQQRAATLVIRRQARVIHRQFLRAIELRIQQVLAKDDPIRTAATLKGIPRQPLRLVEFARAASKAIAPYAAQLAQEALAEDFLEQLNREVDVLQAAVDERAMIMARRVASRVAAMELAARGRRLVRHLDAMISMNLEVDAELEGEWRRLLTMGKWRSLHRRPDEPGSDARHDERLVEVAPATPSLAA